MKNGEDLRSDADEPDTKRKKCEDTETVGNDDAHSCDTIPGQQSQHSPSVFAFQDFKLIKVLREDARQKFVTLHGSLGPNDAVVLLERKHFDVPSLEKCLRHTTCEETFHNDIYSTFDVFSGGHISHMKATLIHPATEKHIAKYTEREPFVIRETPELYKRVVLPCIEESKFSFQWVYNILEKKTESERIVVEDPDPVVGFVMVPDIKWDRKNIEALYLIAIVHQHNIRSIRDLTNEHLPLLKNVLHKGQKAIQETYGVTSDKLRVYFHYQPSYYHLHMHFTHVKFEAPGTDALRAHLLEDVIDNITLNSEFYQQKTLSYVVRENDALYNSFQDKNYFRKESE
uniref:m7GpppX diphosphatase n=1 Tax=Arion vulgaris TaxID=1028688 RepID=A0A0B6ZXP3_9EUPU